MLFLLFFSNFFKLIASANTCLNINASITQNIETNGFHNKINWLLEITSPTPDILTESNIKFAFYLNVSSGIFVNPDEIADLERLGLLSAYIDGDVNIEQTEFEAKNHGIYVFLSRDDYRNVISLPVHLRYQLAQINGGFGKVLIEKPSLLVNTPQNICGNKRKIEAVCNSVDLKKCLWRNITYEAIFNQGELFVPIGNLNHFPLVAVITLLLGCIGCIYILSILNFRYYK